MMTKEQEDELFAQYEQAILSDSPVHSTEVFRQLLDQLTSPNSRQWLMFYRLMCCRARTCTDNEEELFKEALDHLNKLKPSQDTLRVSGVLFLYYAYYIIGYNLEEAIFYAEKAYFAFETLQFETGKWRAYFIKASAHYFGEDYEQAIAMYLTVYEAIKGIELADEAEVLSKLGVLYDTIHKIPESLQAYTKLEKLCVQLNEYNKTPESIRQFGRPVIFRHGEIRERHNYLEYLILTKAGFYSILKETGAYTEAMRYAEEVIELLQQNEIKDDNLRVVWIHNLALVRLALGHVNEAESMLESTRSISNYNHREIQGYISMSIGHCRFHKKRYDEALLYYDDALQYFLDNTMVDKETLHKLYLYKARLFNHVGRYTDALYLLQDIVDDETSPYPINHAPFLIIEYMIALLNTDPSTQQQCYHYLQKIETFIPQLLDPLDKALIEKKKSIVYKLLGNIEQAYLCLEHYEELYEQVLTVRANEKSDVIAALYSIEAERYKNIILEQQILLKNDHIQKLQDDIRMKAHALLQQVQAVNALRNEIITVFDELDKAEDILKNIRKKLNESPLLQRNWEKFLLAFEEISPNFSQRLMERYPEISKTEVRVLILVLSGLNNQEIAELLSVTERSIEKHRLNIRKKLGLKRDQSLHSAMMEIM